MIKEKITFVVLGGAVLCSAAISPAVTAAPKCNGAFQYNSAAGGYIATPYCEDNLVAAVAREYGMRVSDRAVRQSPSIKAEACNFAGSDIRIREICAGYLPEDYRRYGR
jgi:hypothetical protein